MKSIVISLLTVFISTVLAVNSYSIQNRPQTQKEKTEAIILRRINALPEVKSFMRNTPKLYKPVVIVADGPDSKSQYYRVQVGISNDGMFRTNFNFYINPATSKILYLDTMCDSGNCNITLEQWRYWRKKPGWQKMHIYKAGKLVVLKDH